MEIIYTIVLHEEVIHTDIPKLSRDVRERVSNAIREKLMTSPEIFGKPLQHSLKGYRKLRVGDYRIIFLIRNKTIYVVMIGHRSHVYDEYIKNRSYS